MFDNLVFKRNNSFSSSIKFNEFLNFEKFSYFLIKCCSSRNHEILLFSFSSVQMSLFLNSPVFVILVFKFPIKHKT